MTALALAQVAGAGATTYCVVDMYGERCWYHNLETCRQAAGVAGTCVVNRAGMLAPVGGAPWCIVESWRTNCGYRDQASCEQDAYPRRAACIMNPNYRK